MDINDIKRMAVERIYLFPGEHDGETTLLWGYDPAPGEGMDPAEAVEYVRKDVHDAIIKRQASAAKTGMDAAKKHGSHMESEAKRLHAECNPEALESEREANAKLTERVAELERDRDAYRAAEEAQIALRQKIEHERDALASWADSIHQAFDIYDQTGFDDSFYSCFQQAPTTSLARRDALKQVEAMLHVAKWLSGEIEESCIGLDLGGEISGPTGCSDADKCRVAGERIFREAARIWECKFVLEAQQ